MKELLIKLKEINYAALDIDDILDNRDSEPFDSEWVRIYQVIKELKKDNKCVDDTASVREKAFKVVYELSGYGELAECVSDDFGLIADSKAMGYSDEWLYKLIACYENATISFGKL